MIRSMLFLISIVLLATVCAVPTAGPVDDRHATSQTAARDIRGSGNTRNSADAINGVKLDGLDLKAAAELTAAVRLLTQELQAKATAGRDNTNSGNVTTGNRDWIVFGMFALMAIGDLIQHKRMADVVKELKHARCNGKA